MLFDTTEYQSLVNKVNKLKHYGLNHVLSVPHIAIVGDQSSGKSSVLEALTKLMFPRDKGMCTRFATQVNLCRDLNLTEDTLSARIDGEDAFNERCKVIEATKFRSVIEDAVLLLCSASDISDKVLELTLSGPTQSPLTVVDLPGFINTTLDGQDKTIPDTIRSINERFMKHPRTIILAVVPANVDLNNSYVLARAEEYDPKNERTVPIVTKPDMIDKGTLPELIDMVLNNRKKMRLGYLVMCNTGYANMDLSWEQARQAEDKFFAQDKEWQMVPKSKRGRVGVKKFLGDLLYAHIKKELPLLKREVVVKTDELRRELDGMGVQVANSHEARLKFSELTMQLQSSLSGILSGSYTQDYMDKFKHETSGGDDGQKQQQKNLHFIRSSLVKLYQEYSSAMDESNFQQLETIDIVETVARFKGNELPGFVAFTVFINLFSRTLTAWKTLTKEHIAKMHQYLCEAIKTFLVYSIEHQPAREVFLDTFLTFYRKQVKHINTTVEDIFEDESLPFTLNKYYYDMVLNIRSDKAQKQLDNIQRHTDTSGSLKVYANQLNVSFLDVDSNEEKEAKDLGNQLRAYCKVARKRIVDVVILQTLERHMIKHIGLYFNELIRVDDAKLSCLIDSEADQRHREDIGKQIDILELSLLEL
ncbi:hypothetical protein EC991_008230 [Linnemannia zychae]|nr:hypothetical protein EC991_008230 [Linnemannia zychae]